MAKILITDDAAFMRTFLRNILTEAGHECYEAINGYDLLSQFPVVQPDIVTLDVTMPSMDGITAVGKLLTEYPDAKVIMCSAMGQKPMILESLKAGAKDFLVKPFLPEAVLRSINKLL